MINLTLLLLRRPTRPVHPKCYPNSSPPATPPSPHQPQAHPPCHPHPFQQAAETTNAADPHFHLAAQLSAATSQQIHPLARLRHPPILLEVAETGIGSQSLHLNYRHSQARQPQYPLTAYRSERCSINVRSRAKSRLTGSQHILHESVI